MLRCLVSCHPCSHWVVAIGMWRKLVGLLGVGWQRLLLLSMQLSPGLVSPSLLEQLLTVGRTAWRMSRNVCYDAGWERSRNGGKLPASLQLPLPVSLDSLDLRTPLPLPFCCM